MSEKTKEQLEEQLRVNDLLKEERRISDMSYAKKIVEIILFSMIGMFCIAII